LRSTPLPTQHPVLGRASATPYRFSCYPVAPHTIPSEVRIVVDRRLLPGEDPLQATDGLRRHLSRWSAELDVEPEESMLPAEVDPDAPVVGALLEGLKAEGRRPETFWSANTFDAGYACSKGVPTPMFGPGKRGFAGTGLIGVDMIPVSECATAALVMRHALSDLCGRR
jgi:succinyl-diaminopimelate desuccinylase